MKIYVFEDFNGVICRVAKSSIIDYLDEVVNEIELDENELEFSRIDLIPWN